MNKEKFFRDLTKLTRKHKVIITGDFSLEDVDLTPHSYGYEYEVGYSELEWVEHPETPTEDDIKEATLVINQYHDQIRKIKTDVDNKNKFVSDVNHTLNDLINITVKHKHLTDDKIALSLLDSNNNVIELIVTKNNIEMRNKGTGNIPESLINVAEKLKTLF